MVTIYSARTVPWALRIRIAVCFLLKLQGQRPKLPTHCHCDPASASDLGSFRLGLGGVGGRRIRGSAGTGSGSGAGSGTGVGAGVASGGLTSSRLSAEGFGVSSAGCLVPINRQGQSRK